MPTAGQRRDDRRSQMLVQLVRRDHYARPGLADFASQRWIERDEIDATTADCHL